MARRGWGGSVVTALGVAAGTGAAQLGFGYGLGIIDWTPAGSTRVEAAWVASLAWATWISTTSVIAGAICAHRLQGDDEETGRALRNLALAVAAGLGALITVLLVAVPARAARVPDTSSPQAVAAGYAAVGLLIGMLLAVWALHSRAVAGNLVATIGWLWLLAVVSVVDGVLAGRGLTTAQLGSWQISADSSSFWIRDYLYWPGPLLALGSALVIGVLAARGTARLPERRVGAAASGAAGPFLVALAYLLSVPRGGASAPEQVSAQVIAPYAVIAGFGGSVLVAALAQRAERRTATHSGLPLPHQLTDEPADLPRLEPDQPAAETTADEMTAETPAAPATPDQKAATESGTAKGARVRATSGRGRAVPPQRTPSDSPAHTDAAGNGGASGDASVSAPTGGATGPATDAKARRRSR